MKRNRFIISLAIVGVLSLVCQFASAEAWNWHRPFKTPGKNIETLIIAGNYRQPRLIADLIQNETNQPIIILPSDGSDKAYFLSGDRSDKTLLIKKKDFASFLKFCNPGTILILGDKHYTTNEFTDLINSKQTKVRISNKYWLNVVETIQHFFGLTYLTRDYKEQMELINSGKLYEPATKTSMPVATMEDEIKNIPSPVEEINTDPYTPPPFVFKPMNKQPEVIIEDPKPLQLKNSPPKPVFDETIKKEDTKIIKSKKVSEPKLIDENQYLPK